MQRWLTVVLIPALVSLDSTGLAAELPTEAVYAGPWEVRQIADDRVSAAVWLDSEDEHPARGVTAIYLFVFEDNEWRLDDSFISIYAAPSGMPISRTKKRRAETPELVYVADLVGWPQLETRSATPVP